MNKFALIVSIGIVISIAGCTSPNYSRINKASSEFIVEGAVCLIDNKILRFEINNDSTYFYARAIIWGDYEEKGIEKISHGRSVSDYSEIIFDIDNNKKDTRSVDRNYSVNPLVKLDGLFYTVALGKKHTTTRTRDNEGKAYIKFIEYYCIPIRLDFFKIPLKNLQGIIGKKIGVCFYGASIIPNIRFNSVGFKSDQEYYGYSIPYGLFHEYVIK